MTSSTAPFIPQCVPSLWAIEWSTSKFYNCHQQMALMVAVQKLAILFGRPYCLWATATTIMAGRKWSEKTFWLEFAESICQQSLREWDRWCDGGDGGGGGGGGAGEAGIVLNRSSPEKAKFGPNWGNNGVKIASKLCGYYSTATLRVMVTYRYNKRAPDPINRKRVKCFSFRSVSNRNNCQMNKCHARVEEIRIILPCLSHKGKVFRLKRKSLGKVNANWKWRWLWDLRFSSIVFVFVQRS